MSRLSPKMPNIVWKTAVLSSFHLSLQPDFAGMGMTGFGAVRWCCAVTSTLSASTPFVLFLQPLTHPQQHLFAFCPSATRALHSPGTRQLHSCVSLPGGQVSPPTKNWQPQVFLNYGFWAAFFMLTKWKQSRSLSKSTPQVKRKPKWKHSAETRYHHACLSVQGRKHETKMTDICCTVQSTISVHAEMIWRWVDETRTE